VLEQLAVLIESSVNNQAMLCRQRLIRVILVEFQDILTVRGVPSRPSHHVLRRMLTLGAC